MAGVIDSFFAKLGFQVDAQGLDKFQAQTTSLRASILAVGALATVAAGALGAMMLKVAQGMDDVGDFADIVGMTAREVAALGKVASMNDSSMEAMKSTIQGLSSVTGQAALGIGRGAKIFETLGFEAKDAEGNVKGAYDMLGEIADRMKDMSAGEKLAMASKLGIDASLIPLLSKGSAAFRQLKEDAEAANPLTEEQYKQADTIVKLWNKAIAGAGIFTKLLAAKLFPIMERVLTYWNDMFKAGKKATGGLMSAGIDLFVASLVTLWDWMGRIVDAVKGVFSWVTQFKIVTWAAGAAVAALIAYQAGLFFTSLATTVMKAATALFTFSAAGALPVILIGLLVTAVILLVDELVNFYEGNETVIGQLLTEYPNAIKAVVVAIGTLVAAYVALKWQAIAAWTASTAGAVRGAVSIVSAAAVANGGLVSLIGMYATAGAAAMAAGAKAALAWLLVAAPIAILIAAIAAIGYAIYQLWTNWEAEIAIVKADWETFTSLLKSKAKEALDYVAGLFDAAKANVMAFIDGVTTAIGKVGELLGMSGKSISVETAAQGGNALGDNSYGLSPLAGAIANTPAMTGAPQATQQSSPAMTGVLGRAANVSNSNANTTNSDTTNITGTVVNITSNDPAKAGESVREALQNQTKRSIRNGQSAKQL